MLLAQTQASQNKMEKIQQPVRHICITERNVFTQGKRRVHCKAGLRELESDLTGASADDFSNCSTSGIV